MRKILLLFCAFVTLSASAQYYTGEGWYRLANSSETLYMTVNTTTGALTWEAELLGADAARQQWAIQDHVQQEDPPTGYIQIVATVSGSGNFTMAADQSTYTGTGDKTITVTTVAGDPISDTGDANYGYDQFQRRRTNTSVAPTGQNDALFIKVPGEGGSRYGVTPSSGAAVQFDGGAIDLLVYDRIRDLGDPFEPPLGDPTMTSNQSGDWDDPTVWTVSGPVANTPSTTPTAEYDVIIDDHGVTVPVGYAAECNNLTIQGSSNGRFIVVQEGASLNVSGDLITNRSQDGVRLEYSTSIPANKDVGTIIIGGITKSDASTPNNRRALISKQLPTSNDWHLISVGGTSSRQNELARTATTDHNYNIVTNGAGTLFSVGAYNGANAAGSKYEYIPVATYGNTVSFDKIGYAVKVENTVDAARSNIRLRPVIEDEDASEDISDAGDSFNLVGNPYLSYIHANTAAHATDNLLTVNSAVLEEQTIWMWNNAKVGGAGWEIFNLGDAALRIHPAQGFFVKAKSGGDVIESFSYTKAMQSHSKAGEYLRTVNNRFEIDLSITSGELTRSTSIRYIDNTTASFDNGYDSSLFGGYASSLEVYTALLENNSGKKLAIQSLPNANYENMVIPVGVTAAANSEITFTAEALNIPEEYKVYLEDRTQGVFTRLDEVNTEYIATVVDTSTEGRFFLHTKTSETLNVDAAYLNSIRIYKTNDSNLRIAGLKQGKASLSIYNIQGKQILTNSFTAANGVKNVSLPTLAKGVYIVQLQTENGNLNKKIIL